MKNGILLSSIKEMTEQEVIEYLTIIGTMNEIETEKMEQQSRR